MNCGYGIEKWDADVEKWKLIGTTYVGLTLETAKKHISQLRKWAKDDDSDAKYRRVKTTLNF